MDKADIPKLYIVFNDVGNVEEAELLMLNEVSPQ
jgi:hypothetical protein